MTTAPAAHNNPFRMQQVEQVRFEPQDTDWPTLLRRLETLNYRAAIVGPHGSGKTTLLENLAAHFTAHADSFGFTVVPLFTNTAAGRALPPSWRAALANLTPHHLILADGYDLLGPLHRRHLRRATRCAAGLIVTTHRRPRLPTLIRCRTSVPLLGRIASDLLGWPLPEPIIADLHRRHRGNLRRRSPRTLRPRRHQPTPTPRLTLPGFPHPPARPIHWPWRTPINGFAPILH